MKTAGFSRLSQLVYNQSMILLIGPSASGKTAISKALRKRYGIIKAITHTTRAPRKGEANGVDYYFVTDEEFDALDRRHQLIESTLYDGHRYGCTKNEIDDDKCVIVDPNGYRAFTALKEPSIVTFFLRASEATRKKRMKERGDKESEILTRIENDRVFFDPDKLPNLDYIIETDKRAVDDIATEIYRKYIAKLNERGIPNPDASMPF